MGTFAQWVVTRRAAVWTASLAGVAVTILIIQAGYAFRPAVEPSVMEGSIARLDVVSRTPRLGIEVENGQVMDVGLDRRETVVLYGGQPATVDQLVIGRRVKTYYVQRGGQPMATSVVVQPPVLSFPPPKAADGSPPGS